MHDRMQFRSSDVESLTPEQRTAQFFSQDPFVIAQKLVANQGTVIGEYGTGKKVKITKMEAFPKYLVGKRYRAMNDMKPGDLWNPPMRQISQSLIVSQDENGVGACVRLLKVAYFDPSTNSFVSELALEGQEFKQREGDIAKYLGLNKHERSQLKFLDSSDTLYLIREGQQVSSITPEEANREMENLLN